MAYNDMETFATETRMSPFFYCNAMLCCRKILLMNCERRLEYERAE